MSKTDPQNGPKRCPNMTLLEVQKRSNNGPQKGPLYRPYFRHVYEKEAKFENLYWQGTGGAFQGKAWLSSLQGPNRATTEAKERRSKEKRFAPRRSGGWRRPRDARLPRLRRGSKQHASTGASNRFPELLTAKQHC